eukprot:TRINITY_DN2143_c0_g2_i3.p1 TRINITY_DN2143_c0_g2~~TRINITY_DN2143_c0_g2_i3.p1  ORF type:complete len:2045 (-),score=549.72 TRINITY_DN2143_c0_g2_i3:56-6190(-)
MPKEVFGATLEAAAPLPAVATRCLDWLHAHQAPAHRTLFSSLRDNIKTIQDLSQNIRAAAATSTSSTTGVSAQLLFLHRALNRKHAENAELPDGLSPFCVGWLLLFYLRSLPHPLLPSGTAFYQALKEIIGIDSKCCQCVQLRVLLQKIPPSHLALATQLCGYLLASKLSPPGLYKSFGNVFFGAHSSDIEDKKMEKSVFRMLISQAPFFARAEFFPRLNSSEDYEYEFDECVVKGVITAACSLRSGRHLKKPREMKQGDEVMLVDIAPDASSPVFVAVYRGKHLIELPFAQMDVLALSENKEQEAKEGEHKCETEVARTEDTEAAKPGTKEETKEDEKGRVPPEEAGAASGTAESRKPEEVKLRNAETEMEPELKAEASASKNVRVKHDTVFSLLNTLFLEYQEKVVSSTASPSTSSPSAVTKDVGQTDRAASAAPLPQSRARGGSVAQLVAQAQSRSQAQPERKSSAPVLQTSVAARAAALAQTNAEVRKQAPVVVQVGTVAARAAAVTAQPEAPKAAKPAVVVQSGTVAARAAAVAAQKEAETHKPAKTVPVVQSGTVAARAAAVAAAEARKPTHTQSAPVLQTSAASRAAAIAATQSALGAFFPSPPQQHSASGRKGSTPNSVGLAALKPNLEKQQLKVATAQKRKSASLLKSASTTLSPPVTPVTTFTPHTTVTATRAPIVGVVATPGGLVRVQLRQTSPQQKEQQKPHEELLPDLAKKSAIRDLWKQRDRVLSVESRDHAFSGPIKSKLEEIPLKSVVDEKIQVVDDEAAIATAAAKKKKHHHHKREDSAQSSGTDETQSEGKSSEVDEDNATAGESSDSSQQRKLRRRSGREAIVAEEKRPRSFSMQDDTTYRSTADKEKERELLDAVAQGDAVHVAQIVQSNSPQQNSTALYTMDEKGQPLLYVSCAQGSAAVASLLLQCCDEGRAGAPRQEATVALLGQTTVSTGATPLHAACEHGCDEVVALLLKAIANLSSVSCEYLLNKGTTKKFTPLFLACLNGNTQVAKLLLNTGAVDVDSASASGATPLLAACSRGHLRTVKLLLNRGADRNRCKTDEGEGAGPLFVAAQEGHTDVLKLLLRRHASEQQPALVDQPLVVDGTTPLFAAAREGHTDVVRLLLKAGAKVDAERTTDHETPLYVAASRGHAGVVSMLLEAGALPEHAPSEAAGTPLHAACAEGNAAAALELARRAPSLVHAPRGGDGLTPLELCCAMGHTELLRGFLQYFADRKSPDKNVFDKQRVRGVTPLVLACQNGHIDTARTLVLHCGVDVNQRLRDGTTTILKACAANQLHIASFLAAYGASLATLPESAKAALDTYVAEHPYHNDEAADAIPPPPAADIAPPPLQAEDIAPPPLPAVSDDGSIPPPLPQEDDQILPPPTPEEIAPPASESDITLPQCSADSDEEIAPPPGATDSDLDIAPPSILTESDIAPPSLPPSASSPPPPPPPPLAPDATTDIPPPPLPFSQPGAWAASLPPDEAEKLSTLLKKRWNIVNEILQTENTYIQMITWMVEEFQEPLRSAPRGLTQDDIYHLFANVEVIRNLHLKLQNALNLCVINWTADSSLGKIFLDNIKFLKLYKYYVNNHGIAHRTLAACKEKHPLFNKFMQELDFSPVLSGLNLEGLLIAPVQRIPRYVLLLTDMLRSTPSAHPDHELLKDALEEVRNLADYINERKHEADNKEELNDIQDRFSNYTGYALAYSQREFIYQGPIALGKKKMKLWLFSDMLVLTSADCKKGKFRYKQTIDLKTASLQEDDTGFKLFCTDGVLKFQSAGADRDDWIKRIKEVLSVQQRLLLRSAFVSRDARDVEGSRHFNEMLEAENETKRLGTMQRLAESEREYVQLLFYTFSVFLEPMKTAEEDGDDGEVTPDMIKHPQALAMCTNFEQLLSEHEAFLDEIEERLKEWEQKKTLTDLFQDRTQFLQLYRYYIVHHARQMQVLETALKDSEDLATWLADIEQKDTKKLTLLLERPVRRLAEYYLLCQEMLQYTSKKHADYEPLSRVVAQLQTLTENVKGAESKSALMLGTSSAHLQKSRKG